MTRAQRCTYPGCDRLTLREFCERHRQPDLFPAQAQSVPAPRGPWAVAADFRREQERQKEGGDE